MIPGKLVQNPGQTRKHPTIATRPEYFVARRVTLREVSAVAKEEVLPGVIEVVGGRPELLVGMCQVAFVAARLG
jgi:hypothetical protein